MDELFKLLEEEVIYWNISQVHDDSIHHSMWAPTEEIIKFLPYKNKFIKVILNIEKRGEIITVKLTKVGILKLKILKSINLPAKISFDRWNTTYSKIRKILNCP